MKAIAQVAVIVLAIPAGLFLAWRVAGLEKIMKAGQAVGKKFIGAPIQGGAQRLSGRVANWGAQRGFLGRTAARVFTGSVYPGGRNQMERIGEAWRKGSAERRAARGSYRATPSSRMTAEALEKTSVEAIQRWVNNPGMAGDVEALRQMVIDTPSIKLSTAQRKALFSGGGRTPLPQGTPGAPPPADVVPGAPTHVGPSPVAPGAPNPYGPGLNPHAAPGTAPVGALPYSDRPVGGQSAFGRWWSERPTVLPGVRTEATPRGVLGIGGVAAHYLGGGSRQWAGWFGRAVGRPGNPPPGAPAPNPPRGPGAPFAP